MVAVFVKTVEPGVWAGYLSQRNTRVEALASGEKDVVVVESMFEYGQLCQVSFVVWVVPPLRQKGSSFGEEAQALVDSGLLAAVEVVKEKPKTRYLNGAQEIRSLSP